MKHEKMKEHFDSSLQKFTSSLQTDELLHLPKDAKFDIVLSHPSGAEFRACIRYCRDKDGNWGWRDCDKCH